MVDPGRYTLKRDGVELVEVSATGCDRLAGLVQAVAASVAAFYGDDHDDPYRPSESAVSNGAGVITGSVGGTDASSVEVNLYDVSARLGAPAGQLGEEVEILIEHFDPENAPMAWRMDRATAREVLIGLASVLAYPGPLLERLEESL